MTIGGENAWYMLGHTFWDQNFSKKFVAILDEEYDEPETVDKLWEDIYLEHIDELHMRMRKYPSDFIFEFDTLDELRTFDKSYITNTRSAILKNISRALNVPEAGIYNIKALKDRKTTEAIGFTFDECGYHHTYLYDSGLRD